MNIKRTHPSRQRGVALAVALILLVVTAIIAVTAVRFTILDMRVALNEELRVESMQTAQSVLDAVIARDANIVVFGDAGFTVCTTNLQGCDRSTIELPQEMLMPLVQENVAWARVEMRSDAGSEAPPRLSESLATSLPKMNAASFEIEAHYDRSDAGQGSAEVAEGLILLFGRPN